MNRQSALPGFLLATFLLVGTTPAFAQSDSFLKGVLRGTLKNTVLNEINRSNRNEVNNSQQSTSNANAANTTVESNRQVQTALNHFGYAVGTVDGILGKRSRNAVAQYQRSKGYSATGTLSGDQRSELVSSWRRSTSGNTLSNARILGAVGLGQQILQNRRNKAARNAPTNTTVVNPTAPGATTVVNTAASSQRLNRRRALANGNAAEQATATSPPVSAVTLPRTTARTRATQRSAIVSPAVQPGSNTTVATPTGRPAAVSTGRNTRAAKVKCRQQNNIRSNCLSSN